MNNIDFSRFGIKPESIKKRGSISVITTKDKKYVVKKNKRKIDSFNYLLSRNFNNFPNIYTEVNDDYFITDYIEELNIPKEQKLEDIVYLASILHTKTTFYKQVDDDYIKNIYESILDKLNSLYQYYTELQNIIEMEVYMSPANYLLIRNISMIYLSLRKAHEYLEKWYSVIKEEKKVRFSYIHGNLDESHLIENDDLYLVSWDKSRIDLPIYDIETLYKNNYMDINLENLLSIYESKYQLKKEEYYLLLTHLLIPDKIEIDQEEYLKTKKTTHMMLYLDRILLYLENDTKKTNYYQNHQ